MGLIKTAQPALHADQHLPIGSDPIPGLPGASPIAGSYEETVVSISDLLGYWRLGETGAPWADTSGTTPPADLTIAGTGTAPTPNVPGALSADDDGAVEFNYAGMLDTGGKLLQANPLDARFALFHMTVACWINVKADAGTWTGTIIGNPTDIAGSPHYKGGWALQTLYPSRRVRYTRGQPGGTTEVEVTTSGGVVTGDWYFVVGTYDGAHLRLYLNAVLIGETADTTAAWTVGSINIGGGTLVPSGIGWFYGTVDEAAVWSRALTLAEIELLYTSGVASTEAGGSVLISDGAGGATWGLVTTPAIADDAVTAEKIATGAVGTSELADTAVTTGTYGDSTHIAQFTVDQDGRVTAAANIAITGGSGGTSPTDTAGWMPLTTVVGGVPDLVWDSTDSLIPTYGPF